MKYCLSFLFAFFLLAGLAAPARAAAPRGPAVDPSLLRPEAWLGPDADAPILNAAAIARFNRRVIQAMPETVYDLRAYPASLDAASLDALLRAVRFPEGTFYRADGRIVDAAYRERLSALLGHGRIAAVNPVRYGVTVRRSDLRAFPTAAGIFSSPADREFDQFQETAFDPGEAVAVLAASTDDAFYFVQTRHYRGWLAAADVALTPSRTVWEKYIAPQRFLIVTAARYSIDAPQETVVYQMGAKIPLRRRGDDGSYLAVIPGRGPGGALTETTRRVRPGPDVHEGYLPYTQGAVVRQSFRMLGDVYGWGGLKQSVDCSSFIDDIYRTMGFVLPRNADEQERVPGRSISLAGASAAARLAVLRALAPGATLYMNGHVMLYLGEKNGVPYVIHSLGSYYAHGRRVAVMRVVVSDLTLRRANGLTFLDSLTSVNDFR